MHIRRYLPDDRECVVQLIVEFFDYLAEVVSAPPWITPELASEMLKQWREDRLLFCGIKNEAVVALVRLREDNGVYWVENLVVGKEHRRRGLGSELLGWVEEWIREQGARSLFLDVIPANLASLDFFIANGFKFLNTLELRKNFYETPPKKEITLFGRRLEVHSMPASTNSE